MADTLKFGIAGCGRVAGERHIPGYLRLEDCTITALWNRTRSRADRVREESCPGAVVYDTYEAFLAQGDTQAISICTPNFLHADMTVAALEAGKHVLVEKPMAMSLAEAWRMIDAAKANHRVLMVHQNMRDHTVHQKARELVQGGAVGRIYQIDAIFAHPGPVYDSPSSKWFLDRKLSGLGCTGDIGIHKIDAIRYITGAEATAVASFASSSREEVTVEDNASSVFLLDNGAIATVTTSWKACKGIKRMNILGEQATLLIDLYKRPGLQMKHGENEDFEPVPVPVYEDSPDDWYKSVTDFVRSIRGEIPCPIPGEEGYRSLEAALAAVQAARMRQVVQFPLPV